LLFTAAAALHRGRREELLRPFGSAPSSRHQGFLVF
jgi:hypothetical protein